MATHTVKPGDCFCSIAQKNGFYNYQTVFRHDTNSEVCGSGTNPNMLVEGARVAIPEKTVKKVTAKLNEVQKFVIDRKKTTLRLIVVDDKRAAIELSNGMLKVGTAEDNKTTKFSGLLEMAIDPAEKGGKLTVSMPAPAAKPASPAATPPTPPVPPPHPPTVEKTEFEDKSDDWETDPVEVEWTLAIGHLEPVKEFRGAMQRLNNLGSKIPDLTTTTTEDKKTARVVKSYQNNKKVENPSGRIADIRTDLENDHDKE